MSAATLLGLWIVAGAAAPGDYTLDPEGLPLRVAFDPGERVLVGAYWRPDTASTSSLALEAAWLTRTGSDDGAGVVWKFDHTFADTLVRPGADFTALRVVAYEGYFLRWSRDGSITFPTSPPARIPFPLDIGVHVRIGDLRTRADAPLEVRAAAAHLVFDLWRSPRHGSVLAFEVGTSYDVWIAAGAAPRHRVAPFTSGGLRLAHQWARGRQRAALRVSGQSAWGSESDRWWERAEAELDYEIALIAINDQPIALRAAAGWSHDETLGPDHDLYASLGLRLAFPTD